MFFRGHDGAGNATNLNIPRAHAFHDGLNGSAFSCGVAPFEYDNYAPEAFTGPPNPATGRVHACSSRAVLFSYSLRFIPALVSSVLGIYSSPTRRQGDAIRTQPRGLIFAELFNTLFHGR